MAQRRDSPVFVKELRCECNRVLGIWQIREQRIELAHRNELIAEEQHAEYLRYKIWCFRCRKEVIQDIPVEVMETTDSYGIESERAKIRYRAMVKKDEILEQISAGEDGKSLLMEVANKMKIFASELSGMFWVLEQEGLIKKNIETQLWEVCKK